MHELTFLIYDCRTVTIIETNKKTSCQTVKTIYNEGQRSHIAKKKLQRNIVPHKDTVFITISKKVILPERIYNKKLNIIQKEL